MVQSKSSILNILATIIEMFELLNYKIL